MEVRGKPRAKVWLADGTLVGENGLSIRDDGYPLTAELRRSVAAGWAACARAEAYAIVLMHHESAIAEVRCAPSARAAVDELQRQYDHRYRRRRKPKTGLVVVSTFAPRADASRIAGMGAHVLFALTTTPENGESETDFLNAWLGVHRTERRALVSYLYKPAQRKRPP